MPKEEEVQGKFMTKNIVNTIENMNVVTPEAELSEVNDIHFNYLIIVN